MQNIQSKTKFLGIFLNSMSIAPRYSSYSKTLPFEVSCKHDSKSTKKETKHFVPQSIRCLSPIAQIRIKHIMNKIMEVGDGN